MTGQADTATRLADVARLRHSGAISAGDYLEQVQQCRDAPFWHGWAMRALLVLGAAHFLAGVVFFFAYNWEDLAPFAKFAILQSAILLSFVAALVLRLERPAGQAMLIASSVFTGVLFAVVGQVYQTGADAWELFVAWSVLILPWVFASKSAAHWLFWIVICLTAASLYGEQVLVALGHIDHLELATAVGVLPALFLAVRELALYQGVHWLAGNWFRRSLAALSLVPLWFVALQFVFDSDTAIVGFTAFVAVAATFSFAYLKPLPDFSVLAVVVALVSLLAMAIGGRLIFEILPFENPGTLVLGLLCLGGWCVFVMSMVVRIIRFLHRQAAPGAAHA